MSETPERPAGLALRLGGRDVPLQPGRAYHVGRGEDNELRINHSSVAERHLRVTVIEGGVFVEDLGSGTGTRLGAEAIRDRVVGPGDTLRVGDIPLKVVRAGKGPLPALAGAGGLAFRHRHEATFAELMADELRRAPWFLISIVVHALVFLVLYWLSEMPEGEDGRERVVALQPDRDAVEQEFVEARDDVEIRREELDEEELLAEDLRPVFEEPEPRQSFSDVDLDSIGFTGSPKGLLARIRDIAPGDILKTRSEKLQAGGFRKTVSGIRRTGLDIVFVFDSTGSMGSIIQGTKERIATMVEALHALVRNSRIGIVTYRDDVPGEEYVTRSVPLSDDVYRAMNFMHVVGAGGGGDRPEAVLEGLGEAFRQDWSDARRVVILVGDAPAHGREMKTIRARAKAFAQRRDSFVHAIVTSPYGADSAEDDVLDSFSAIAQAGRGACITFEDEQRVLRQVLSLAFGHEYRSNIDEVFRLVTKYRERIAPRFRDMVRRADLDEIEDQLGRRPVPDDLVKALLADPRREVAERLIAILGRRRFPASGRQAAAYVVQRLLDLRRPPIDPERGEAIGRREVEALHKLLARRM